MKKNLLLVAIILPLTVFSQTKSLSQQGSSEMTSTEYLQKASKHVLTGTLVSIIGSVAGTTMILASNRDGLNLSSAVTLTAAGSVVVGASAVVGDILLIKGYKEIGKAGNKLNYEIKGTSAKLAFVF